MHIGKISTALLATFAIMALCAGCVVQSMNPLYSPDKEEVVFDPALLGTWGSEKGEKAFTFEQSGEKTYKLIYEAEELPAEFEAHLVQLGDFLFLDVNIRELKTENPFFYFHLAPTHTFSKISIEENTLQIKGLDDDWFWDNRDKFNIRYERLDSRTILMADTPSLQEFVLENADDPKAFAVISELHRLSSN